MTTSEQVKKAYQLLVDRWSEQGYCTSCGWHALLEEHEVEAVDVAAALETTDQVLHLGCASPDEDAYYHRGVFVSLAQAPYGVELE